MRNSLFIKSFCTLLLLFIASLSAAQELDSGGPLTAYGSQTVTWEVDGSNLPLPLTVNLTSSSSCVQVPSSITLTAYYLDFPITTTPVLTPTKVVITATASGATTGTGTITILPPLLTGLNIGSGIGGPGHFVQSNTSGMGYVTLNYPAPTGGLPVTLAVGDSPSLVTIPSALTVPAGQVKGYFP